MSDWLIVVAAFSTVVLATVLLAAGPIYADAVAISALQRSVGDAPVSESGVLVEANVPRELYEAVDTATREVFREALATTGSDVFAHAEGASYGLAERIQDSLTELVSFQYFEGIESHASIRAGEWPEAGGGMVEAALLAATAETLGLSVGDVLRVVNRRDADETVDVVIAGIYEIDPLDHFWFDDVLSIQGQADSASFRTYGPLVVPLTTMLESFTRGRVDTDWRALPRYEELAVEEVDVLREEVAGLAARLNREIFETVDAEGAGLSELTVRTGLANLLASMDRSLSVTRATVVALLIQLSILAGYALVLTAGLLSDTRRSETVLLRSRGTSPRQILLSATLEGLLLTVPAILVGPYLATLLLRLLNTVGPLAAIDLRIEPLTTTEAYVLASIAGGLSIVSLAWPAYRSARAFGSSERRNRRQLARGAAQRVGLDVALIVLTVIVFWQLQGLSSQISSRVGGQFGVDPLLVLAPALGLLAGAVLALRMIPLLARIAEWIASSGRASVNALAAWQVARRPARYARSALLLILAIGIGFFAASYATTWTSSQSDQAGHLVGANLSVTPDRRVGEALPDFLVVSAHESTPGVSASMPVRRLLGQLSQNGAVGQFVVVDAAKAPAIVRIRPDLAPSFASLMGQLRDARPELGSVPLPGEPVALRVQFGAQEQIPEDEEQCGPEPVGPELCFDARVRLVLQDGNDMLHRVDAGKIAVNEGVTSLEVPLVAPDADGRSITPSYPLSIVNIEIESQLAVLASRLVELKFAGIDVVDADGTTRVVPGAIDRGSWELDASRVVGANVAPSIVVADADGENHLVMTVATGSGFNVAPAYFSIRPSGTSLPPNFPVVVSDTFPATAFEDVGDQLRLPPLRIENDTAVIAGTISAFPSTDANLGEVFVLDFPTYQMMGYEPGSGIGSPDFYWAALDGPETPVPDALASPPINSFRVESEQGLVDRLVSDPVALGTIGALTVGFVAAAVFAAVGFAVSATVSARERLVEFALMRALGLSPRQLGVWLLLEQGVLVLLSLALGTALGALLTSTILPLVTLTQDGRTAVPEVIVQYPWPAIAGLEVAVVVVLAVIVSAMIILLRRIGLGSLLRMGED